MHLGFKDWSLDKSLSLPLLVYRYSVYILKAVPGHWLNSNIMLKIIIYCSKYLTEKLFLSNFKFYKNDLWRTGHKLNQNL